MIIVIYVKQPENSVIQVDVFLNAQLLQYHEKLCFVDFLDEIEDVQDFVLVFVEYLNNVWLVFHEPLPRQEPESVTLLCLGLHQSILIYQPLLLHDVVAHFCRVLQIA